MIAESLWILLLGMVSIFVVMGVIAAVTTFINRVPENKKKDKL